MIQRFLLSNEIVRYFMACYIKNYLPCANKQDGYMKKTKLKVTMTELAQIIFKVYKIQMGTEGGRCRFIHIAI